MNTLIGYQLRDNQELDGVLQKGQAYLALHYLQEKANEQSPFAGYYSTLPKTFFNFPIFFGDEDKSYLKGSMFEKEIIARALNISYEYQTLCEKIPDVSRFTLGEYMEAQMVVASRAFSLTIDGEPTLAFIPYVDMMGRQGPKVAQSYYCDEQQGFVMEAVKSIE